MNIMLWQYEYFMTSNKITDPWMQTQAGMLQIFHTLKTVTPIEDEDSILKLLHRVSRAEIQSDCVKASTSTPVGGLSMMWYLNMAYK